MGLRCGHGGTAVARLADHDDVLGGGEHHPQTGPNERVVVDEQNLHCHGNLAATTKSPLASGPCDSVPPARSTRSRKPISPLPDPGTVAPTCNGCRLRTLTDSPASGAPLTRTVVAAPGACLAALVSASWTMRYASRPKAVGASAETSMAKSIFAPARRVCSTNRGMSRSVGWGTDGASSAPSP